MTRREELYVAWLPAGTSGTAVCWHATWSNPIAVTADGGKDSTSRKGGLCIYKIVKELFNSAARVLGAGWKQGSSDESGVDFGVFFFQLTL